jgi:hypothetical protein
MASFTSLTHALHGGGAPAALRDALRRGAQLAAAGRIIAVAAGETVELFDAGDVADVSAVLGPGAIRIRFIASFAVVDIADAVTVSALAFLRGGLLAVAGVCARGTGAF